MGSKSITIDDLNNIGLQIAYGYYGGDPSKTNPDDMKEYVIDNLSDNKEDQTVLLTAKALSSFLGSNYERSSGEKIAGMILSSKNLNTIMKAFKSKGLITYSEYQDVSSFFLVSKLQMSLLAKSTNSII